MEGEEGCLERDKACVYCGLTLARVVGMEAGGGGWRAYDEYGARSILITVRLLAKAAIQMRRISSWRGADCILRKSIGQHPRAAVDPRQGRLALMFEEEKAPV